MTPLEKVQAAFSDNPLVQVFEEKNDLGHTWIRIAHELIEHEVGVQPENVTDESLALLVSKVPRPRKGPVERWNHPQPGEKAEVVHKPKGTP